MESIDVILRGDDRRLNPTMSSYTLAKLLGCRCEHIDKGSPVYINDTNLSVEDLAKEEIRRKLSPMSIKMPISSRVETRDGKNVLVKYYDIWDVNEIIVDFTLIE